MRLHAYFVLWIRRTTNIATAAGNRLAVPWLAGMGLTNPILKTSNEGVLVHVRGDAG
jgi:hypothetical protein